MSLARSAITRNRPPESDRFQFDDPLWEGLRQRAALLEGILADLSGPRTLVCADLLPARLMAGFETMFPTAAGPWLRAYAAELIGCADGQWRVAADLTASVGSHPAAMLLQAPALASFLPALCRHLLGETLRLPSLPSMWLGDAATLPVVAANASRWMLVDSFRRESKATLLAGLSPAQRITLQERVDAEPWRFTARLIVQGESAVIALSRSAAGDWISV